MIKIYRYGTLLSGAVVKETKQYSKAGEGVVSLHDPRIVTLSGQQGKWILCCTVNELPTDATLTDKATYDAYRDSAIALGLPLMGGIE